MTLRELILSVDSEQYSDSPLFQKLRKTKPEYGSNRHIQVKLLSGEVAITNVHVGSLGDILTYPIDQTSQPFGMNSTTFKKQRLSDSKFLCHLFYQRHIILMHFLSCRRMASGEVISISIIL